MHKLDLLKQLQQPVQSQTAPQAAHWRAPVVLLAVVAALSTGWALQQQATASALTAAPTAASETQAPPPADVAATVQVATNTGLNSTGYVIAQRKATVAANETGRIARVLIREGDFVEKGQLIAEMDNETLTLEVAYAKSQLKQKAQLLSAKELELKDAKKNLQRDQQLFTNGLIAKTKIELSENAVAQLNAQLQSAKTEIDSFGWRVRIQEKRLADTRIVAPFSGIAVQLSAQIGEIVSPMSAGTYTRSGICTLVDMTSLELEVDVNESYLQKVSLGQQVVAQLSALPDKNYAGVVSNIIPTADRQTATVKVRIRLDQLDSNVLPDMAAKVVFQPETQLSLSKPQAPTQHNQG